MTRYASGTSVSEDRSRQEIERTLMRYGATRFAYMREPERVSIAFTCKGLDIEFTMPLPDPLHDEFTLTPTGRQRRGNVSEMYEQEVRRRWRALTLCIKSKLVAVDDGVATFEMEFMPYIKTAGGPTIGTRLLPLIEASQSGKAPLRLALPTG